MLRQGAADYGHLGNHLSRMDLVLFRLGLVRRRRTLRVVVLVSNAHRTEEPHCVGMDGLGAHCQSSTDVRCWRVAASVFLGSSCAGDCVGRRHSGLDAHVDRCVDMHLGSSVGNLMGANLCRTWETGRFRSAYRCSSGQLGNAGKSRVRRLAIDAWLVPAADVNPMQQHASRRLARAWLWAWLRASGPPACHS